MKQPKVNSTSLFAPSLIKEGRCDNQIERQTRRGFVFLYIPRSAIPPKPWQYKHFYSCSVTHAQPPQVEFQK